MRKVKECWKEDIAAIVYSQYQVFLLVGCPVGLATWCKAAFSVGVMLCNCGEVWCNTKFHDSERVVQFYGHQRGYRFSLNVPYPKFEA